MAGGLIEEYLQDVHDNLELSGAYRKRVVEELRDHLHDARADGEANGLSSTEAAERAISSLGPASEVATRFAPAATRWTRLLAVLAAVGAATGLATIPLANRLQANGERLGADIRYSLVWVVGLLSALAVVGLLVALAIRLGTRPTSRRAAFASTTAALALLGLFHLASDGTLEIGPDADTWRLAALVAGLVSGALLIPSIRRAGTSIAGPVCAAFAALFLLGLHLIALDQRGPVALVAACTLAAAWSWAVIGLARERPLA